jgi:hypothetical protein
MTPWPTKTIADVDPAADERVRRDLAVGADHRAAHDLEKAPTRVKAPIIAAAAG